MIWRHLIAVACAGAAAMMAGEAPLRLESAQVAVEAQVVDGALIERFQARRNGAWVEVAAAAPGLSAGATEVVAVEAPSAPSVFSPYLASGRTLVASRHRLALDGRTLVATSEADGLRLIHRFAIEDGWVRVTTRLEPARPLRLFAFADQYRASFSPDWSYSPSVGGFNPDAKYKSPLILVQHERTAFGIVPDVGTLDSRVLGLCPHALDLDVPGGPLLSVGFLPARLDRHSVFAAAVQGFEVQEPLENAYLLEIDADADPGQAYRRAVRLHWARWGRAEQAGAAIQQRGRRPAFAGNDLWDAWRASVWGRETPANWLEVPLPTGGTGGAVAAIFPARGVILSSWFNSLRTAVGMGLYARRAHDDEALRRARKTLDFALGTPGRDGAFKCLAVPAADGTVTWWAGDGRGAFTKEGFLGYDMSWTAYWLLKWRAAGLPDGDAVLPRCQALARFLISRQGADGLLPTRFGDDGAVDEKLSRQLRAETAPVALFLLELNAQAPDPALVAAALKGLAFLDRAVVATRQWYDFEAFFSCAPRTDAWDERTGQWPANNLALSQAAIAYLRAWQTTHDRHWLEQGEKVLDYLLLFQQCWTSTSPSIQELGPAMLLGGFTTQNNDAEWSDARQSQIGNALLDWYRETGTPEYLERGVAALRATFPVAPAENHAHSGYGGHAGVSSFHWGTGSGMAGIELEEDFLRDAIVDLRATCGVGVNGLDLTGLTVDGGAVAFALTSPFPWKRPATVIFRNAEPERRYTVTVNGAVAGTWAGRELMAGVGIAPGAAPLVPPGLARGVRAGWGVGSDRVLADFDDATYRGWIATGTAFGDGPTAGTLPDQNPVMDFMGKGLANSFHGGDAATGTLTSPEFVIDRAYLNLLVGGGASDETAVVLLVDGTVVRKVSGRQSERLAWATWDLTALKGRTARVSLIDRATGGWGHILADQIALSDSALAEPGGGR